MQESKTIYYALFQLTNGLATSKGGLFLTSKLTSSGCPSFMTLVTDICTTCVLAEEQSLCASGIAIAANLSRYKVKLDQYLSNRIEGYSHFTMP